MKQQIANIKSIFRLRSTILITVISLFSMALFFYLTTNYKLIKGNLGWSHFTIILGLQGLISLFFGINLSLLYHKIKLSRNANYKSSSSTVFGSFLSVLVSGCPACSITLASYLGLSSFLSALPFFGIELKIAGLGLLLYSTNYLAKNLYTCNTR